MVPRGITAALPSLLKSDKTRELEGWAVETLRNAVIALAERWNAGDIRDDGDSLAIRFTPAQGIRTFVTLQSQPDALFAPLYKIEVSTLVGNADFTEELIEFLDASNSETVCGAWERFEGGDIGVTGVGGMTT